MQRLEKGLVCVSCCGCFMFTHHDMEICSPSLRNWIEWYSVDTVPHVLYLQLLSYAVIFVQYYRKYRRSRWCSGYPLASHLSGWRFKPWTLCGKVGSCLLMVGSLQYRNLSYCMYRFPLPTKLPIME